MKVNRISPNKRQAALLLGQKIKNLRESQNLSQGELAQSIGVSQTTISKWEMGINDKTGEVEGVENTEKIQKSIRHWAEEYCYPKIKCNTYALPEKPEKPNENFFIAVVVDYSTNRPHFAGPAYVRVGSSTEKASKEMFEELIASRHDKVRRILRDKNNLITVRKMLAYPPYQEDSECRIEWCDAFQLKYRTAGPLPKQRYAPLERIEIDTDDKEDRTMLTIKL